jgi:hypothetical protein
MEGDADDTRGETRRKADAMMARREVKFNGFSLSLLADMYY